MGFRAITFDLDDTLWPIDPVIERAEATLHAWLELNAPNVARQYPPPALRALRDRLARSRKDLAHDLSALRRLALTQAAQQCGYDAALADRAFDVMWAARNEVELYEDVVPALATLALHFPLAGLTNGNADIARCGVGHLLSFCVSAREFGKPKPDPSIFRHAAERFGLECAQVLHVGDDPERDVRGAQAAGLRAVWLNRSGARWVGRRRRPDLEVRSLAELVAWVEQAA